MTGSAPAPQAAVEAVALTGGYAPGVDILHGASLRVEVGEIVGLIGPNGAGKSTLARALLGLVPLRSGQVLVGGTDVTRRRPHTRVQDGVGFLPQVANVFPRLAVRDNLLVGAHRSPQRSAERMDRVVGLLPVLRDRLDVTAGLLSGGQRQALALGRALMADPTVLVLDEPTAGLDPPARRDVVEHLLAVNAAGVALLVVEQNVRLCIELSHRMVVLDRGRAVLEGSGPDLVDDPEVRRLCLGGLSRP